MKARTKGETGMILVIVLWTVAIMTVVAVALTTYVKRNLGSASAETLELRSEMALKSSLNIAAAMILSVKEDDRLFLDGATRQVDLGGGRIAEVSYADATGRIDLNKVGPEMLEGVLIAALESKGAGKALAAQIMDLRKKAAPAPEENAQGKTGRPGQPAKSVGQASMPLTPEGEQPAGGDGAPKPQDHPPVFLTPLQLLSLKGIEPEDLQKVLPFVTVASRDGKINPMTAPIQVLRAVPTVAEEDLALIMDARKRRTLTTQTSDALAGKLGNFLELEPPRVFLVSARIVKGENVIAGTSQTATILLTPEASKPFQVLTLSW